ncbi:MAG: S41 family peptidase, partial [Acidobacteriota bacterium]
SGVAERTPTWSPDGRWIAYFADASGEYELYVRAADGSDDPRRLTELGEGFRYTPYWSPDGSKLAFVDQAMRIQIYDMDADAVTPVDQGLWMMHGGLAGFEPGWSSDSRWLAYARGLDNRHSAVFLYDVESGERHQVTSGFYSEARPTFDPDGDYLYVLTNRNLSPVYSDFQNTWVYPNSTQVAAIPLRDDVPSPLAPRNDEEDVSDEEDEAGEEEGSPEDTDAETEGDGPEADEETAVEIDLDGLERRLVVLPAEAGNYSDLAAVSGKVIYHRRPRSGSAGGPSPVVAWDLESREEAPILEDADAFTISADGKKMLAVSGGRFGIVDVAPGQKLEEPLDLSDMTMTVEPMAEWRQIFNDVWRLFRDYFYVPNMHGVDWDAMGERYSALLDDVVTRWDLDFLIGELIGELNAGHTYNGGGGDVEEPEQRDVGLLGVDFAVEDGAYRIARIIDGAPWDSEVRSPLAMPGVDVDEGDWLLAVNGMPLDTSVDPWAPFEGLAGETVELTVNDTPSMEGARTVLVETLSSEARLRNLAWIDANRRRVEEATDGRVGYVYVPDTGINGQTELLRQWAAQIDTEGLIIDERFNNGGQIPDRFVELLNRPLYSYWGVRDGKDWQWPPVAHPGPKVMLINGWSGSGGDAFPWFFREAGVGPLIGTRTWGGLIGISGVPGLIDGGSIAVPTFGIYSLDGEWIIEGHGVDPDIEVIDDPTQLARGTDPQLERAIQEVLRMLEESPVTRPDTPAPPDRSGH